MQMQAEAFTRAKQVRLLILDVDGTLTDGGIYLNDEDELFKPFFARDGLALRLWQQQTGHALAIITGRSSTIVQKRAQELGIEDVWMGHLDKRAAYASLKTKYGVSDAAVAYIGDDLVDLPILCQVGFPIAVSDAVDEVRQVAQLITEHAGGRGAVREAIEFLLKAQGLWQAIIASFQDVSKAGEVGKDARFPI